MSLFKPNQISSKFRAAVLGGSGSVGKPLIKYLIEQQNCEKIILINRKNIAEFEGNSKVEQHVTNMEKLNVETEKIFKSGNSKPDIIYVTMGVGSPSSVTKENLFEVDVNLPTEFAKAASSCGVKHAVLLTSVGSDINAKWSNITKTAAGGGYYVYCKGQVEKNYEDQKFQSLAIFKPGTLIGSPNTPGFFSTLAPKVDWLLPERFRSIHVEDLAGAMVEQSEAQLSSGASSSPYGTKYFEGATLFSSMNISLLPSPKGPNSPSSPLYSPFPHRTSKKVKRSTVAAIVLFVLLIFIWQVKFIHNSFHDKTNIGKGYKKGKIIVSFPNNNKKKKESERLEVVEAVFNETAVSQEEDVWSFAKDCSIIYTWANGSIKEHQELYNYYKYDDKSLRNSFQRFRDNEELKHSLRSYTKNMAWHRGNIFLVVPDGHVPEWINLEHPRLKIINQSTLVDEEDNPTFNTNAIEQNFYKIPGLTDHFIAVNDDIFFGRELHPIDFFTEEKGVNFFFENSALIPNVVYTDHVLESRKTTAKALIRQYDIKDKIYSPKHAPFVYLKEVFPVMKELFAEELKNTSTHKFRHVKDLVTPILHHYTLMNEKKVEIAKKLNQLIKHIFFVAKPSSL
ncbi:hypothetical protein HDU92_005434 [Lobulomyces angularis]|nr:hypothetical protein HDU92_005434 [Lobulomyces angularis]